jgi:hypothetical protein
MLLLVISIEQLKGITCDIPSIGNVQELYAEVGACSARY